MADDNNPFLQLSSLFVENQRVFNIKRDDLLNRLSLLGKKLEKLSESLKADVFSADLVSILNIEEESALILGVAKELEFQRDQVLNSVKVLSDSRKIKLNK